MEVKPKLEAGIADSKIGLVLTSYCMGTNFGKKLRRPTIRIQYKPKTIILLQIFSLLRKILICPEHDSEPKDYIQTR